MHNQSIINVVGNHISLLLLLLLEFCCRASTKKVLYGLSLLSSDQ